MIIVRQHNNGYYTALSVAENYVVQDMHRFDTLDGLASYVSGSDLVWIIPGEDIFLSQVHLPKIRRKELKNAVPFALEEQLAVDLEDLYFALGAYTDDSITVAVMDLAHWQQFLDSFQTVKLNPRTVTPDFLTLVWWPKQWTVLLDETVALVRLDEKRGFATDLSNLFFVLKSQLQQEVEFPEQIKIFSIRKKPELPILDELNVPIQRLIAKESDVFAVEELIKSPVINLLQTTQKRSFDKGLIPRSSVLWVSIFLFFTVSVIGEFSQGIYFSYKDKKVSQQLQSVYQSILGDKVDSSDASHQQVQSLLSELGQLSASNPMLSLLKSIGPAWAQQKGLKMVSMDYQNQQLRLILTAKSISMVDDFVSLVSKQGLVVRQNEINTQIKPLRVELIIVNKKT